MSRRGNNWAYTEVIDLLDIWGEQKIQKLLQSSYRNMDTFQVIASEMAKRGHERTAQECRTKTKTMRRDYKKAKDNSCSGTGRIMCPFYEQLDRILAGDSSFQLPRRLQNITLPEESSGDTNSPCPMVEGVVPVMNEDYVEGQDPCSPCTQIPVEISDSATSSPMFYVTRGASAKPASMSWPAANVAIPSSPTLLHNCATLSSDGHLTRVRKRQRKTRNDLVMELSRIADRRVQTATDRILSSLNRYATADLQDRERDRADTAQIIAIMHRQTELLESLVQMQSVEQSPVSPAPSWHARPRSAISPPSRSGVPRRTLMPRVNHRRRPQKYSP
ncbi:zinc finger and SCAN domain-containing protein 20-like isoform X2 [Eublepharis macularius]|uniref:Zinc finger and SCAN domain-containing protein 20-like isoform X2 n=1 Tax=Eublepharis macularius TaxID=481883 RepID=A0AA97L3J3_EUBMA|nr:zinc finger and SCAN domain-containing protein 20-like isoform X2 [Eublepharis macularius]